MTDLLSAAEDVIASDRSRDEKLLEVCALVKEHLEGCDWVGFYIVDQIGELVLGPYIGAPTDHVHIPLGKGVCGRAAQCKETIIVDDVSKERNYLACSMDVKSEIVVPIKRGEEVLAELDIDSHRPACFGCDEKHILESLCSELAPLFYSCNQKEIEEEEVKKT